MQFIYLNLELLGKCEILKNVNQDKTLQFECNSRSNTFNCRSYDPERNFHYLLNLLSFEIFLVKQVLILKFERIFKNKRYFED